MSGGVDYTFPTGVEIPANGLLVMTEADVSTTPLKDAFRAKYTIPSDVQIFGPWQGSLNNGGEDVNINKVGPVDPGDSTYPVIRVDRVEYSPTYPWSSAADGTGKSLERINPAGFGNDPFNWQSFRNGNPGYQALLQGDANRDGRVSFADYLVLESNFGQTGRTWLTADFNNDGKASFADYLLLEANFGRSVTLPGPSGAPPMAAPLSLTATTSQPLAASAPVDLVTQASTATVPAAKTQVVRGRKLDSAASALFKLLRKTNLLG
jgi:hypothetical protein